MNEFTPVPRTVSETRGVASAVEALRFRIENRRATTAKNNARLAHAHAEHADETEALDPPRPGAPESVLRGYARRVERIARLESEISALNDDNARNAACNHNDALDIEYYTGARPIPPAEHRRLDRYAREAHAAR